MNAERDLFERAVVALERWSLAQERIAAASERTAQMQEAQIDIQRNDAARNQVALGLTQELVGVFGKVAGVEDEDEADEPAA